MAGVRLFIKDATWSETLQRSVIDLHFVRSLKNVTKGMTSRVTMWTRGVTRRSHCRSDRHHTTQHIFHGRLEKFALYRPRVG